MTSILHTYTAFKSHLEHIEAVISSPGDYSPNSGTNAVPVSSDALHLAKDELKADMAKISKAIDATYVLIPSPDHLPDS